ncbi:unnamed protein product [Adineta ricciae]|uniref:Phorbol-ester/DAG-type domain-containing protein n=1 Tax=Adineta ricciae TaxID=249248 RepID=A0A813TY25_ADIRI|nr:unnamed protein product [Adineta ricciae]CAF1308487.1 unnamed protein product [Adineta ricciae]
MSKSSNKWSDLVHRHTRSLSRTFERLSFLHREEPESSLSSSLPANFVMQQCLSKCEPDVSIDTFISPKALEPCKYCFEQVTSPVIADVFNTTRERLCSDPVNVPNLSTQQGQQQSHSTGYGSMFGNELSPATDYWTIGMNDSTPHSSVTQEDEDQSMYDVSSITDGGDEESNDEDASIAIDDDDDTFEVLSFNAPPESTLYIKEFPHTTSASQNYACACCNELFSSISNSPPRRCYYYGKLYCSRCHIAEYACIPAKLIKTSDTRLYPVCRRAKSILQLNIYQPVFDVQHDNESLYTSVSLLADVKSIRVQFHHYYAYLSTCPRIENEFQEKFFKEFYARDYLYQSVHLYSVDDLLSLKKILHILTNASIKARQHINHCEICREKGFTCEICKNRADILYPFDDTKSIGRCDRCSNLYHRQCWQNIDHDCPKCYRLVQRQYLQEMV